MPQIRSVLYHPLPTHFRFFRDRIASRRSPAEFAASETSETTGRRPRSQSPQRCVNIFIIAGRKRIATGWTGFSRTGFRCASKQPRTFLRLCSQPVSHGIVLFEVYLGFRRNGPMPSFPRPGHCAPRSSCATVVCGSQKTAPHVRFAENVAI